MKLRDKPILVDIMKFHFLFINNITQNNIDYPL